MTLSPEILRALSITAQQAARQAGQIILSYAEQDLELLTKPGAHSEASQALTEVDLRCETRILELLNASVKEYDLGLLSEEQVDDRQRLSKEAFWCVDPLDGTLAFAQSKPGYSVSIALVSRLGKPLLGVVYDPLENNLYSAVSEQGLYLNNQTWQPLARPRANTLTLPCDQSLLARRDAPTIRRAIEHWRKQQGLAHSREIHHGGAVMNACAALAKPPGCYFKLPKPEQGGGSLWDFAATASIYSEAGAIVSDFRGEALDLNRPDTTFMNQEGVIFSTEVDLARLIQSLPEHTEN